MKLKWLAGIVTLFLVVSVFIWYNQEPALDEAFVLGAEEEIRDIVGKYTAAMSTQNVEKLAGLVSFPFELEGGQQVLAEVGFVSRMSHAFRNYVSEVYELAHEITNIDVKPDAAVATVIETSRFAGEFGALNEWESTILLAFRKLDDGWRLSGIDTDALVSLSFRKIGTISIMSGM